MTPAVNVAAMAVLWGCGGDAPGPQDGGLADDATLDAGVPDGGAPDGAAPWQDAAQDATGDTFDAAGAYCEECEDECDVRLTVEHDGPIQGMQCWYWGFHAEVCNRGSKDSARAGQVVRFATDEMHVCDASTTEPLAPGMCVSISCFDDGGSGDTAYATLNPEEPHPACADPDDRTDEDMVLTCD